MKARPLIAVASRSFSSNLQLREQLLSYFPNCRFNEKGLRLQGDELRQFLAGAAGAVIGLERIDAPLLQALPDLNVISKYGVGLDSIDITSLERHNIRLVTNQGTNSRSVAELSLMLILAALRRIPEILENTRTLSWSAPTGRLLTGKTVGLVGVGNVGRALTELLIPFHCTVLGFDVDPSPDVVIDYVSLTELLCRSDVVSIHVPMTKSTLGLIGATELAVMKNDAVLINTARGSIVDEAALLRALESREIAGACLDVLEKEPPLDWDLARSRGVLVTPHIAGTSEESNYLMGQAAIAGLVENLHRFSNPRDYSEQ